MADHFAKTYASFVLFLFNLPPKLGQKVVSDLVQYTTVYTIKYDTRYGSTSYYL